MLVVGPLIMHNNHNSTAHRHGTIHGLVGSRPVDISFVLRMTDTVSSITRIYNLHSS